MHSYRVLLPVFVAALAIGCSGSGNRSTGTGDVIVDPYWEYRDEVERGEFSYDDSEDVPWIETETAVPEPPETGRMFSLRLDTLPPDFDLLVDRDGITIGEEDRIVRLWLQVVSRQGSATSSYEGYRCNTAEYKVFAYANPARHEPMRVVKRARWRSVDGPAGPTYRGELLRDYLCGLRGTRSVIEIQQAMTGSFDINPAFPD